jgi:hypothetical protein
MPDVRRPHGSAIGIHTPELPMIPTIRCPLAALASLTFACAAAAQTVTVGPPGSGAMFASIQAGINAAQPGGVVLVAAGSYGAPATLTIDKPVTLLGAGSSSTTYSAQGPGVPSGMVLPLRITGLAAGEHVSVSGMRLVASNVASIVSHARLAFEVIDCAGPVALSDLVVGGMFGYAGGLFEASAVVRDAAMVTLDRCRIDATTHFGLVPTALRVERSLVHVNACSFLGSQAPNVTTGFDGAPGIVAIDATVRVARSDIRGGAGVQFGFPAPNPPGTAGGAAIHASGSDVLVRGGPGNELRGGLGGGGGGRGGAAVFVYANSLVATTPDVVAVAGLDGSQQPSTPAIDGPGLHVPLAFPLATIAVAAPLVAPGGVADFALAGEPLAACLPLLALGASTGFSLPGVLGLFAVDPAGIVTLPVAMLDAVGAGGALLPVPPSPSLAGIVVHAQSLSLAPSGWISVSGPTLFAVR